MRGPQPLNVNTIREIYENGKTQNDLDVGHSN